MIEVVGDPCGQKLPQCHGAELRVPPAAVEVCVRQAQRRQLAEVVPAQRRELVEQGRQRLSLRICKLRQTIEPVEGPRLPVFQVILARGTQSVRSP